MMDDRLLGSDASGADEPGITAYRPGSAADFDRLYQASYQRVLYTLVAVLGDYHAAEDCAQEAFVRALRAWDRWQPDAPAEAWVHRIALNVAASYRRWHRLRSVGEVLRRLGPPGTGPNPGDVALRTDLVQALSRLPAEQAATVVLRHYHGYSNREIAHALGVPESTVAARLAAGKKRLQADLGRDAGEDRYFGDPARSYDDPSETEAWT